MTALSEFTHQILLGPDFQGDLSLGYPKPPANSVFVCEVATRTAGGEHAERYDLSWTDKPQRQWELWGASTLHGALHQVIARKPHLGESAHGAALLLVAWIWKCRTPPEMSLERMNVPGILSSGDIEAINVDRHTYFHAPASNDPVSDIDTLADDLARAPGDLGPPFMQRAMFAAWNATEIVDGVVRRRSG